MTVAHWDDVEPQRRERGHIAASWRNLGTAAGSVTVGVQRIEVEPGRWSTPAHSEGAEEEIFFVLGGSGLSWQYGAAYEVAAGDCLVHRVGEEEHTLRAGPDGLDVLAFGERALGGGTILPRAGVAWLSWSWVEAGHGEPPWAREAAAGEPEVGELSERPARIVALEDVGAEDFGPGESVRSSARDLGTAAGSVRTGLNHVAVEPGKLNVPPHCHSAEEELFVVLEGEGTLELTPSPRLSAAGRAAESHPVRAGSVVARPAGTRVAHAFRAGDRGLTLLAYGTRDPNDIAYYPRSNKVSLRGVGVIARLEHVDYWDGEG